MCVEPSGVPPLLPAGDRGPADRIPPSELTAIGGTSDAWVGVPPRTREPGSTPIVVLCHERYGVVLHTTQLAARLSASGFLTIAPDFYADVDLTGHEERLPEVPDHAVLRHLDAAISYARGLPGCGGDSRVAVIGVCRSGSYGIVADAERTDVAAVVMLYGGAQEREFRTGELRSRPYEQMLMSGRAPVLGLWGERDHIISVDDVRRVRDMFESGGRSYDFVIYPGMPHGWLNDTMPGRFRSAEAEDAFATMADWLDEKLHLGAPAEEVSWSFRSRIAATYDFTKNERLH